MRNKGAIKFVAIALALVCVYQLSFTYFAANVRKQAKIYATDENNVFDKTKEAVYLDSIASETVYSFFFIRDFNYRECQEREINLGLDLKGGMNVVLQVAVEDVIVALSENSQDSVFKESIKLAKKLQRNSQDDFVKLFGQAFAEIAPNGQLAAIFATKNLRDKVSLNSSNDDVLKTLKKETQSAIDNSFNILRNRIDRFGVAQPNIQPLETDGQILVELPGIKNPERVKKLLQGTANLEFWETYSNSEVHQYLIQANQKMRELSAAKESITSSKESEKTAETKVDKVAEEESVKDSLEDKKSLLDDVDTTIVDSEQEFDAVKWKKENPLFAILNPRVSQDGTISEGAAVGYAHKKDTAEVNHILNSDEIQALFPRSLRVKFLWGIKPIDAEKSVFELVAIKVSNREGLAALSGDAISDAREEFGNNRATAEVSMAMNSEGAKKWARLTKNNIGKQIAIVLDDFVYSYPVVQGEISGGRSSITGNFTVAEAKDLANILKSGKLPAPARIIQEEIVGPSLGLESINKGLWSFALAFLVVLLYMILYYRHAGWIANIALLANVFFILGVLASLGAVLTLPGIAGIVLTMGMSVDANVLIYERIKEEISSGKGMKMAIADGYQNAYSAIIDSNLTSLLTAIILGYFGQGPIYGFAITLGIGILTSLFSAIFITRLVFEFLLDKNKTIKLSSKFTDNLFSNVHIKFIEKRKIAYVISGIVISVGVVSLFTTGLNLGVDFTGGHTYIVRFNEAVTVQDVRDALDNEYGDAPDVKTFGGNNQVKITTKYMIETDYELSAEDIAEYREISGNKDPELIVEAGDVVEAKLYRGLSSFYTDFTFTDFVSDEDKTIGRMSSMKVGPTIADDIKTSAIYAVFFALLVIFLYILIRFSNWQYGLGAVISLSHDVLFILGFYAIFKQIMPFSMEIDQAFIAAILTVVGYSINDTVVVFDRIREYFGLYKSRDRKLLMNQALNSTLSRTVNTSLTTFLVMFSIFIFGGEVIRGFIFAMMLGIIVGTYSSLFVATPIAYDLMKKKFKKIEETKK
ncbi:MAG: protein translocase subunit SecDF [Salinivirgaceae bacterium]|nr:protein translocase subunit SecDF [Salinivirgaceae bacterium]